MKPGQIVRIKNSNLEGEVGILGKVTDMARGGAGSYVYLLLPAPYGGGFHCVEDLEIVDPGELEFVTADGNYGVVLERTKSGVRIQFEQVVENVDPATVKPSCPEELLVFDVMTR